MLLGELFAHAAQLETRAVHEKMQGLGIAATAGVRPRLWHLQRRDPATEDRMVRHAQRQPEQADHGADQPLGLAVGQAEHDPEREGRQDGERRIPGLPTPGCADWAAQLEAAIDGPYVDHEFEAPGIERGIDD